MPGYHSRIRNTDYKTIGNLPILTFQTNLRGPVTNCREDDLTDAIKHCPERMDIIEEAIHYFRGNVFLSKFEIRNPVDRLLVYLTLYILECLKQIARTCVIKKQAELCMINFAQNQIWTRDDQILNFIYKKPDDPKEAEYLKLYLYQIREETGHRLCQRVFEDEKSRPSKWWICFAKRKFLNLNLTN